MVAATLDQIAELSFCQIRVSIVVDVPTERVEVRHA